MKDVAFTLDSNADKVLRIIPATSSRECPTLSSVLFTELFVSSADTWEDCRKEDANITKRNELRPQC